MAKMGRPEHKPTKEARAAVESLAGMGHSQEDICSVLGIGSTNTLAKHYGLELRMGRIKANDNVAKSLYKQALDGNTTAAIWWEKTRAGKSERHELTGRNGGPILTRDVSKLTDEQLDAIEKILTAPGPADQGGTAGADQGGESKTRH